MQEMNVLVTVTLTIDQNMIFKNRNCLLFFIIRGIVRLKSLQNILTQKSDQYFKDKIYCELQQMNCKNQVKILITYFKVFDNKMIASFLVERLSHLSSDCESNFQII